MGGVHEIVPFFKVPSVPRLHGHSGPPKALPTIAATTIAALVAAIAATSSQSFWIDEAHSAYKAMQHSFADFISCMQTDLGSDTQMPLYMIMLWTWEKVFGHSEFALRAMNIPLFAVSLMIATFCWRTSALRRAFLVAFACSSAFLWAYLDEARPYILQFLGATACAISMANVAVSVRPPRRSDIALVVFGALLLCGSSLLGVIFAFWFSISFLLLWLMRQPLAQILQRSDLRLAISISVPALVLLGVYYCWTLSLGAGASAVGSTSPMSIAYAAYDLLGMAGFGPGRGELRLSHAALLPHAPQLSAYGLALGLLASAGTVLSLRQSGRHKWLESPLVFWAAPAAMAATTIMIGVLGDFRIVGRHLTPLLPFLLIFLSFAASTLWQTQPRIAGRAIAILSILAMLGSALAYRTSQRHAKDDYRSAAEHGRRALENGGSVWWAADQIAAHVYGLQTIVPHGGRLGEAWESGAFMANNRDTSYLASLPAPSLVVLSKTDVYDREGNLRRWLVENGYTIKSRGTAFEFYGSSHDSN
jgi:hypothetical protein